MPRRKRSTTAETPPTTLEGYAVLEALRSNQSLLQELAMRYQVGAQPDQPDEMPAVNSPQDAYNLIGAELSSLAQEQLRVLLLNTKNKVIGQRTIYQGNVAQAIVRPAEVFRPAIIENAPRIIIAHNHPSGDPTPSPEDRELTRDLIAAGNLLDIQALDHLVIGRGCFVSIKEEGRINW